MALKLRASGLFDPKFIKAQKVVNVIDEHSYTLYLVHGMVFCSLIDRLNVLSIGKHHVLIGFIAIGFSLFGTAIIHRWIEKPIQQFLRKRVMEVSRT